MALEFRRTRLFNEKTDNSSIITFKSFVMKRGFLGLDELLDRLVGEHLFPAGPVVGKRLVDTCEAEHLRVVGNIVPRQPLRIAPAVFSFVFLVNDFRVPAKRLLKCLHNNIVAVNRVIPDLSNLALRKIPLFVTKFLRYPEHTEIVNQRGDPYADQALFLPAEANVQFQGVNGMVSKVGRNRVVLVPGAHREGIELIHGFRDIVALDHNFLSLLQTEFPSLPAAQPARRKIYGFRSAIW